LQLHDHVARGAICSFDPDEESYSVYCSSCEQLLPDEGGPIPDHIAAKMGVRIICEVCMDRVLELNGTTRLN
jgi:hypothetical protein